MLKALLLGLMLVALFWWGAGQSFSGAAKADYGITKEMIARALVNQEAFPEKISFNRYGTLKADYSFNQPLQIYLQKTLEQYRPDYGAVVAVDATTGAILSLNNFSVHKHTYGNLALQASFPAASVFKLVTAAAAIDRGAIGPDTIIEFNGGNHTLYRRNVTELKQNRWTRRMTLRDAFARSVNTVFGKVGIHFLLPRDLEEYARRFQFNQEVTVDLPAQPGTFILNPEDPFAVAEAASGYSRLALMSPLQGAMMAASVINDGTLMEPYVVRELKNEKGEVVYRVLPKVASVVVSRKTASELRELMSETVKQGTARKSYRDLFRKKRHLILDMGGKTGSLSGNNPKGKYDWYVGYATDGDKRLAVAALTINGEVWRVKASYLARLAVERYFKTLEMMAVVPY